MRSEKALKILDVFSTITNSVYNDYLADLKKNGGKIVGYTCSYFPEEIVSASGGLPFRMRGERNIDLETVDQYVGPFACSYVTHYLETALGKGLDFLDGMIFVNTCDHMRRMFENIKQFKISQYTYILDVPKNTGLLDAKYYRDGLEILKKELETQYSANITDEKLWDAIRLHNKTRTLQKSLYELRKTENPPITGAETLAVMVAGTSMPKKIYNEYLKELIEELKSEYEERDIKARLMVVGDAINDPEFLKLIEDMGGLIVTDSICYGTRTFWHLVDESEDDPLMALAKHYVADRPLCPHSIEQPKRSEYVMQLKKDFSVDGIIGARYKFCELWGMEHHYLENNLEEAGIPFLNLETEYKLGSKGQVQTRVQAFLELIEGGI